MLAPHECLQFVLNTKIVRPIATNYKWIFQILLLICQGTNTYQLGIFEC